MKHRYLSPLRYPGGKARMAPYLASLIRAQSPRPTIYVEPFAGGAGAALRLLIDEAVRSIHINDLSPGIAAFWRCVFYHTEQFARMVEHTTVDIDLWHHSRKIFESPDFQDDIELGFATFYLNRCNRSGILTARPIGGLNQTGKWKIDARFNKIALADRIRAIGKYRRRVELSQLDGCDFLNSVEPFAQRIFAYVDPPYIVKGEDLYLNSLSFNDHQRLALFLRQSNIPWMLTYDVNHRVTQELYTDLRTVQFDISHTAQNQHIGSELVVFSNRVNVVGTDFIPRSNSKWIRQN